MGFSTKKELLEYLGKNPNDNKLVDRLILRGEVCLVDGMYEIVDKEEEIKKLKERVIELENEQGKDTLLSENKRLKDELYIAQTQWEHYEDLYNMEVEEKQNKIRKCFMWIKNHVKGVSWEEFRDWVMGDEE